MIPLSSLTQETWESVAEIGFVVVIVGVAMEAVDVITKWRKRKKTDSILSREPSWLLWIETISLGLVVLGLGTEFFGAHKAEMLARKTTDQLQQQTAEAIKEAGAANEEAALAKKKTALVESNNLVLRTDLTSLELQLALINPRIQHITTASAIMDNATFTTRPDDGFSMPQGPLCLYIRLPEPDLSGDEQFKFVAEPDPEGEWGKGYHVIKFRFDPLQLQAKDLSQEHPLMLFSFVAGDVNNISKVELETPVATNLFVRGSLTINFNSMRRTFEIHSQFDKNGKIVVWQSNAPGSN